ncbi:MAG: hypothetical protein ABIP94_21330 [Planctomycetota bacterium]
MSSRSPESFTKQGLDGLPSSLGRPDADAGQLRNFLQCSPREEPQLDDLDEFRFGPTEMKQALIEVNHVNGAALVGIDEVVKRHAFASIVALDGLPTAGMVGQDLPDHPSGQAHEVYAIVPRGVALRESHVDFVHECRGLQRVARRLVAKALPGEVLQFVQDKREQSLESGFFPISGGTGTGPRGIDMR